MHVIKLHTSNTLTQFQSNILLDVQWSNNLVRVMMSLFEMQFLAFLVVIGKNKWYFLKPETKLNNMGMIL